MKYKAGDVVVIKKDLIINKSYNGGCLFAEGMDDYIGGTYIIDYIPIKDEGYARYRLKRASNNRRISFYWSDDMLDPYSMITEFIKKVGKYEI